MSAEKDRAGSHGSSRDSWSRARPAAIPRPTAYPASMAFGVAVGLWGFVTSPVLLGAGGALMVVSLAGWIAEIRHED